nr:hypothetical protein [Pandoravirus belohorizontensis]
MTTATAAGRNKKDLGETPMDAAPDWIIFSVMPLSFPLSFSLSISLSHVRARTTTNNEGKKTSKDNDRAPFAPAADFLHSQCHNGLAALTQKKKRERGLAALGSASVFSLFVCLCGQKKEEDARDARGH